MMPIHHFGMFDYVYVRTGDDTTVVRATNRDDLRCSPADTRVFVEASISLYEGNLLLVVGTRINHRFFIYAEQEGGVNFDDVIDSCIKTKTVGWFKKRQVRYVPEGWAQLKQRDYCETYITNFRLSIFGDTL